ncbi:MAG: hypothetical protein R3313_00355 [Candidatus Saccharimonadales bacterium]|nr:hypothetical protein [Candidatus Saccharimonadales bacterium]
MVVRAIAKYWENGSRLQKQIAVLVFAAVMTWLLVGLRAAGPFSSLELESGDVTAPAFLLNDSLASGGSYVRFGGIESYNFPGAQTTFMPGIIGPIPPLLGTLDDAHGGTIRRLTANESPGDIRHYYSSVQDFNADESVIHLPTAWKFVSAATGEFLPYERPSGFLHWSPTDPNIMIGTDDDAIIFWDITLGQVVREIALPGFKDAKFQLRTHPSNDGARLGVRAVKISDDKYYAIGVDVETGALDTIISFDDYGFSLGSTPEWKSFRASASPTGKYLVLSGFARGEYQKMFVFDWDTSELLFESRANNGVECPGGHGDFAIDEQGRDVFVGVCYGGSAWSEQYKDKTVIVDLATGQFRVHAENRHWYHYSGRNTKRPGWFYASKYGDGDFGEVIASRIDGSRTEYYVDPQSRTQGVVFDNDQRYWSETHASPSPSGRMLLFASSWNAANPNGDSYLLDLSEIAE